MNKFSYTLEEMLKELQATKVLNRKSGSALIIKKGSDLKLKSKKKQKSLKISNGSCAKPKGTRTIKKV